MYEKKYKMANEPPFENEELHLVTKLVPIILHIYGSVCWLLCLYLQFTFNKSHATENKKGYHKRVKKYI